MPRENSLFNNQLVQVSSMGGFFPLSPLFVLFFYIIAEAYYWILITDSVPSIDNFVKKKKLNN